MKDMSIYNNIVVNLRMSCSRSIYDIMCITYRLAVIGHFIANANYAITQNFFRAYIVFNVNAFVRHIYDSKSRFYLLRGKTSYTKSRVVSKPRYWFFKSSYHSAIQ